jgi:branched-chain amino acid transport system permease protein
VIGGVGSVRGALAGALLVGMVDSLGRAFLPQLLSTMFSPATADPLAAGMASASIYVLMAIVLIAKPGGLFPARG